MLSLLESGSDGLDSDRLETKDSDRLETNSNIDISKLKKRLAQYIASECKSSSRFVEYWVPVQLSNVQLEQYCASLLSNSMLLSSCLKRGTADGLRDVIISARKVNPSQTTAHGFVCLTTIFNLLKCFVCAISLGGIFAMAL